jgi:hypothetical protein
MQEKDGNEHVIAYDSRKLTEAEKNYPVHERELLSIVHALSKWRIFMTQKELSGRQKRWAMKLSSHKIKIEYVSGANNQAADALTRQTVNIMTEEEVIKKFMEKLKEETEKDEFLGPIKKTLLGEKTNTHFNNEVCIPNNEELRKTIITDAHDSLIAGHFRFEKTYHKIKRHYFWPKISKFIRLHVRTH